ncbi:MAG TPA: DUF3316 domain-containing protein [Bacteroidales bacterium]|nr:DUF3316 domain-containing protein [Bacteroidales bacterium]
MHLRFWMALGLSVGCLSDVVAQQTEVETVLLTSVTTQVGWSLLDLNDTYLSDLPYSGYGLQFNQTTHRYLKSGESTFSERSDLNLNAGVAMNQPQSASISYFGGNVGYGLQLHLKPLRHLQLLLGGELDAELGVKAYSRDVNNAGNMDLATNLNLAATVRYDLMVQKHSIRLQADFLSPLLGLMFVPLRGESYSEIYYLHSYDNLFHLTSLHNKNGLNARYLVQIPLKHTILNLGLHTEMLKYTANKMFFKRNIISFQVGATYDLVLFGGRKHPAPNGFISSEW